MQVRGRQLNAGEIDHELIWLSVSVLSLTGAALWLALGLPWPVCVFHELTGLPCVTCGMTRCGIEFFHGHFFAASKWNPLVFALLWGVIAFDFYALATLAMRGPRLRIVFQQAEKKYARGVVVAVLALNWLYLLSHWRDF
ncbi:MAG: hypothetical protein DME74_11695 [Verrucomicrobia bacterium]|nr:MAG: hypothetical protein DME74_11695 [Verrucomicrobiota bacterium]